MNRANGASNASARCASRTAGRYLVAAGPADVGMAQTNRDPWRACCGNCRNCATNASSGSVNAGLAFVIGIGWLRCLAEMNAFASFVPRNVTTTSSTPSGACSVTAETLFPLITSQRVDFAPHNIVTAIDAAIRDSYPTPAAVARPP
jgi:hypothetical protein